MDNRQHILECAQHLFATRGYDAVGVQEIVEAAGVTKPTLYHYFGSKRGLLDGLLSESFGELHERVRQAARYEGDLPGTLARTARAYFDFAQAQPDFYRLQLALWFAPPDSEGFAAVAAHNGAGHAILEDLFAQAVTQHGNMRGRARAYAATFLGMLNTYIGMALNGYAALDDTLLHQAVHQFQHGIYS